MAVYVFTGKLGGGKTLCSVGRIKEKLEAGCRVATNLDLDLSAMFKAQTRDLNVIRIPDKPKIHDMHAIGRGNETYDESKNGLICLDECGTWFNSRNWNDKDRKPVNEWFLHARKLGWDVILIIQDIKLLDSQARDALAEHTVFCRRMDRIQIPFIGSIYKAITGFRLHGPRVHVAKAVYGTTVQDLVADRWVYRGISLFACYDTKQLFLDDYPHAVHSVLTPWHIRGRYAVAHDWRFMMRMTRIYWKRFNVPFVVALGSLTGCLLGMSAYHTYATIPEDPAQVVQEDLPPVESEAHHPEEEDDDDSIPLRALFGGYKIVSYIQSARVTDYTIRSAGGSIVTQEQLESDGYIVEPVNNCKVAIAAADFSDITYVHADLCTVREYDKPAFDLRTLPNIPQMAYSRLEL